MDSSKYTPFKPRNRPTTVSLSIVPPSKFTFNWKKIDLLLPYLYYLIHKLYNAIKILSIRVSIKITKKKIKLFKESSIYYVRLGGSRKWSVLLTSVLISADIVGGSEMVQNYAHVIYDWSLTY